MVNPKNQYKETSIELYNLFTKTPSSFKPTLKRVNKECRLYINDNIVRENSNGEFVLTINSKHFYFINTQEILDFVNHVKKHNKKKKRTIVEKFCY